MTCVKKNDLSPEAAAWLVKRRSEVHTDLMVLHCLRTGEHLIGTVPHSQNYQQTYLYQDLLGINFSLWRAVFYADVVRAEERVLCAADDLLLRLVRDNAVQRQIRRARLVFFG